VKFHLGLKYSVQNPEKRNGVTILIGILVCIQLSLIWPIYPLFSGIHPVILGLPFSIVWVLICLLVSFTSLLVFYVWEHKSPRNKIGDQ